ncbi:hypothetical protein [Escherichia coli]
MPIVENIPDLSHWRTVQEFSITQAALLLAGIDPYDYPTLEHVRDNKHERWKMAWGLANGMVTAIRRGVLTPVECTSEIVEYDNWGNVCDIEYKRLTSAQLTDRAYEISKDKTLISRHSLYEWIKNESVDFARCPRPIPVKEVNPPAIIESSHQVINPDEYLCTYGHKSDGLEYVQDAIRELWSTYDPDDPQTAPTEHEVLEYLKKRGAGSNVAKAVNLILRPEHLKRIGRRPKKQKVK